MRKNKFLACLLTGAMAVSLAACGSGSKSSANAPESQGAESTEAETTGEEKPAVDASIDFEDGKFDFIQAYMGGDSASEIELSIQDFEGSKALQVKNIGGEKIYMGMDVSSLLGDKISKVATIEMTMGIHYDDDSFGSVEGFIYTWTGQDLVESKYGWSVYLPSKDPNVAKAKLKEKFIAGAQNMIIISLETDNGAAEHGPATLYVDNVVFKDEDGNKITADSSAGFNPPEKFFGGEDFSNLSALAGAVDSKWSGKADGWAQDGFDMSDEFLAALVPGSVIQIEYKSETGDMWLVFPDAEAWSRVGQGIADGSPEGTASSYYNNSKNIAQITYEQIAGVLGKDTSKWGKRIQCESSGAWSVSSVKVGMAQPLYGIHDAVDSQWKGSGDGWAQNGFDMSDDFLAALVPGSAVEIQFKSENDDMWIVLPDADPDGDGAANWTRVGVGNKDGSNSGVEASCAGGICFITYEQIAKLCGDDPEKWGKRMQCEATGAWSVSSVKAGPAQAMKMVTNTVDSGWSGKGDKWTQDGFDINDEFKAALVPGSVITIKYKSDTGDLWLVFPEAANWTRVGVGNLDGNNTGVDAVYDGATCQVSYEQIAKLLGDDVSKWGGKIQCESSGNWQVSSVSIGQGK